MAWCPQCKCEYRDGITTCAECGSTLVPESEIDLTNKETTKDTMSEDDLLEKINSLRTAKSTVYVKKADRYEDLGSTAIIFLGFGIVGNLVTLLNVLGLISIPFISTIMSTIVLFVMFSFFIVVGITSWIKAKKIKSELSEEVDLTEQINNWLKEHITKDVIKEMTDPSISDEINFLNIIENIKEMAMTEFPDIEEDYIDMLAEEFYNEHFDA